MAVTVTHRVGLLPQSSSVSGFHTFSTFVRVFANGLPSFIQHACSMFTSLWAAPPLPLVLNHPCRHQDPQLKYLIEHGVIGAVLYSRAVSQQGENEHANVYELHRALGRHPIHSGFLHRSTVNLTTIMLIYILDVSTGDSVVPQKAEHYFAGGIFSVKGTRLSNQEKKIILDLLICLVRKTIQCSISVSGKSTWPFFNLKMKLVRCFQLMGWTIRWVLFKPQGSIEVWSKKSTGDLNNLKNQAGKSYKTI